MDVNAIQTTNPSTGVLPRRRKPVVLLPGSESRSPFRELPEEDNRVLPAARHRCPDVVLIQSAGVYSDILSRVSDRCDSVADAAQAHPVTDVE